MNATGNVTNLGSRVQRQDAIANYVSGLGTDADSATHGKPNLADRLNSVDLDSLYLQNDLARRIVDEVVDDAIRGGWTARKPDGTRAAEPDDLDIQDRALEAGKTGRLYGGAHVWMVTDSRDYQTPLTDDEEIVNLVILDRYEASAADYIDDPRNKHWGEPGQYYVTPNANGTAGSRVAGTKIHRSRLLTFGGNPVPRRLQYINDSYDDSVLQSVWRVLRDFTQTEQAIANIVQRFETATISIAGLADILEQEDGEKLLRKRMALLQKTMSTVNAAIVDSDAGEEYSRQYANVTGLDVIWDRLAHSVSKAARMPMTQLFGMSPSGLSSDDESGRANWRKQVAAWREDQLRANLTRYYSHLAGAPVNIEFSDLDETTAAEQAEIDKLRATARTKYVKAGVLRPEQVREKLAEEQFVRQADPDQDAFDDLEDNLDSIRIDVYDGPDEVPENVDPDDREQWMRVFNDTYRATESEARAFKDAYAAVNDG